MKHIEHYINKLKKHVTWERMLFVFIFFVFILNAAYIQYPDEFVNLLGGQFINAGHVPYREFFDHHLPFAWYFSALLLRFSFGSFVIFRFLWAASAFLLLLGVGLYIKRTKTDLYPYYLGFFFLYPFVTVYYWTHLFTADALAFLFFSSIFWLLIAETYKKVANRKMLYVLTFLNFCFLFSSMTFIYMITVFYVWTFYLLVRRGTTRRHVFMFIGIAAAPYLLYAGYLLATNSWKEFYMSNFYYNTKLYISLENYVRGRFFNPIKFALTLIHNFYQGYLPLLARIHEFNLFFPIGFALALGSFLLLLFLFWEEKFIAVLFFLILSFSAPRSNVNTMNETDYQVGVFIALGLAAAFISLWMYRRIKFSEELIEWAKKGSIFLLGIYILFASLFLFKNTYDKFFMRYTQRMPNINNVAHTAVFVDDILNEDEYYWAGPYHPEELFFVKKPQLPGKYISLLPQFREDEYFKNTFLKQFETNPPKLIIYKQEDSIFNTPSLVFGQFFLSWMKDKYTSIENIPSVTLKKSPSTFNFRTDLYLKDSDREELLVRLREKGYIE